MSKKQRIQRRRRRLAREAKKTDFSDRFKDDGLSPEESKEQMRRQMQRTPEFQKYMQDQAKGGHRAVSDYIGSILDSLSHGDEPSMDALVKKLKKDHKLFDQAAKRQRAAMLLKVAEKLLSIV